MTTEEKIEVMQAYVDGEQIQIQIDGEWEDWFDMATEPNWNWGENSYRVKFAMTNKEAYRAILTLIDKNCAECKSLVTCEKCDFYKLKFWVEDR